MRIFSTFSGIGGFEIGIQNAWRNYNSVQASKEVRVNRSSLRPEGHISMPISVDGDGRWLRPTCVGYSEIDKYAISVYERHFKGVKNYGDITRINEKELPDFDCLVGGFPCQAFSIAGKRRGFEDTRGTLFFDLARILQSKQPRLFVFENVKGLLSHNSGRTFKTIIETITELGYDTQWQVLNSKNFGVPQNRERVYIVGHLRGTPRPEVFPIAGTNSADTFIRTIRTGGAASYTEKHARDIIRIGNVNPSGRGMNGNVISSEGLSSTLSTNKGEGIKVAIPEATKKGYAEATVGDAINLTAPNSKTRRGRVSNIAPTLDTGMQLHTLTGDVRIRRLTPKECERLQGFPDNWTKWGKSEPNKNVKYAGGDPITLEPISDTQRYKMCGNAVTTNVVQAVFERIFV